MKEKIEILCKVLEIKNEKKMKVQEERERARKNILISYNEISFDKIYDLINACNKNFSKYIYM